MCNNIQQPTTQETYKQRRQETQVLGQSLHDSEFTFLRDKCNGFIGTAMPFDLASKKISGLPLRGYFFRNLFDMVQEIKPVNDESKSKLFGVQLPFIAETLITIQYYSNQILDNKGGVTTKSRIDENLNIKENLEPALYDYVWQRVFLHDEVRCDLVKTVRQILRLGAIGQVLEDNYTTYQIWLIGQEQKVLVEGVEKYFDREILDFLEKTVCEHVGFPKGKRPFLKTYFQKIYLRNAALYDLLTDFVARHSELDERKQTNFRKFAVLFAVMHQIVNDIGDLVPSSRQLTTQGKTHKDAFADLRNNTVTLPMMIHLLTIENSQMESLLKKQVSDLNLVPEEVLLEELTHHHSIFKAMSIAKVIQGKAAEFLPPNIGQSRTMFLDMLRIAENNKYFWQFYKKKQDYKAYRKACRKNKTLLPIDKREEIPTLVPA